MVPMVALIGRQNVGKSTIFNLLTCSRDAIVADFPGITRDRKYGFVKIGNHQFICIDTGGINNIKNGVEEHTTKQSMLAIKESDIVLFIVDAHSGLMPDDSFIAKYLLRSYKNPTFLVVNKTDGVDATQAITDFWSLGFSKIYPISAFHGRGVNNLLKSVLLVISKISSPAIINQNTLNRLQFKKNQKNKYIKSGEYFDSINTPLIKFAIVGLPNVGKSTLANRILGENRMIVYDMPCTTRDSVCVFMRHNKHKYALIDTAGVRQRSKITNIAEKFSVTKSLETIKNVNVVLLVIDAQRGISVQDLSLLGYILNTGRAVVIAMNKWDCLNEKVKKQIKITLKYRLKFIQFVRVHFISALYGIGIKEIFESMQEAYENSIRKQSTTILTKIMNMALKHKQPLLVHSSRHHVKLKYAHAGGYNPLIVVIHGNQQIKKIPNSYKRYLINFFCKSLNIIGTPIRIKFKEEKNKVINKHIVFTKYQRCSKLINRIKK